MAVTPYKWLEYECTRQVKILECSKDACVRTRNPKTVIDTDCGMCVHMKRNAESVQRSGPQTTQGQIIAWTQGDTPPDVS